VESTAEITALLGDRPKLMLHLDAAMHNKYKGAPQKLREWKSSSHVERSPRPAKTAPVTPSAPAMPWHRNINVEGDIPTPHS